MRILIFYRPKRLRISRVTAKEKWQDCGRAVRMYFLDMRRGQFLVIVWWSISNLEMEYCTFIREENGHVQIGALVTHADLSFSHSLFRMRLHLAGGGGCLDSDLRRHATAARWEATWQMPRACSGYRASLAGIGCCVKLNK
jgi:hypothetical protein